MYEKINKLIGILSMLIGGKVIRTGNGMKSVISLIIVFITLGISIMMSGVEYIGYMYVIIYVGAIAVLFVFVVMMLKMKKEKEEGGLWEMSCVSSLVLGVLLEEIGRRKDKNEIEKWYEREEKMSWSKIVIRNTNMENIGRVLYGEKMLYVIMAGMVLMLGMIGAIMLTMEKERKSEKKQEVVEQVERKIEMIKMK